MQNNLQKIIFENKEKGVSLIIVFFVMIIIITVVLSISLLLYSEIKIVRNMSDSVVSFYIADSGVEKVLYYDRKILPVGAKRGLCYMCSNDNPDKCPANDPEPALNCVCGDVGPYDVNHPNGCGDVSDRTECSDCVVNFTSSFGGDTSYTIKATVFSDENEYNLEVRSAGFYNASGRSLRVSSGDIEKYGASQRP